MLIRKKRKPPKHFSALSRAVTAYVPLSAGQAKSIIDGYRTVLVFPMKPQPDGYNFLRLEDSVAILQETNSPKRIRALAPTHGVGTIFGCTEPWANLQGMLLFEADGRSGTAIVNWRSAGRLDKLRCRIFCQVLQLQMKRLDELTDEEIRHTGIFHWYPGASDTTLRERYMAQWNKKHRKASARTNPMLWVIRFEKIIARTRAQVEEADARLPRQEEHDQPS